MIDGGRCGCGARTSIRHGLDHVLQIPGRLADFHFPATCSIMVMSGLPAWVPLRDTIGECE